ncbi:hypothetical protein F4225_07110 [Candidatus Poribacteria bacterium]|nr:hypothetical protein [Candidatus Poribacteria bacterium]
MKALDVFEVWKEKNEPELILALLNALNSMLVLDFSETYSEGASVRFGWNHLKYTPELIKLRTKAIDIIAYILKKSEQGVVREKAIGSISRAIDPLESPFRKGMEQSDKDQLHKEQTRLFDIVDNHMQKESDFTVLNAIDRFLKGYAENEHVEGFPKQRAAELLTKFSEHEIGESYLLYRQFTGKFRDWDLSESSEKTQEFLKKYIAKYTPEELANLIKGYIENADKEKEYENTTDRIWDEKGWNIGSATSVLWSLGELSPSYGIDLLDEIVAWDIDESHCASGLISGIRISDQDSARKAIHDLLKQGGIIAKHIVARSYYGISRNKQVIVDNEDLEILDQLSYVQDSKLRAYIAQALPDYIGLNTEYVLEILVQLSTDDSANVMRNSIDVLGRGNFRFSRQKHLEKYKQIMQNCISLERLDYESERVLHTIFKHDPIWVISFFEERIVYKENMSDHTDSYKYDAVPNSPHYVFNDIDWNAKNTNAALRRVRDWVLKSSNTLRFEAPRLLASMLNGNESRGSDVKINGVMRKLFEEWIDSEDIKLMQNAAYLMRGFHTDAVFYSLLEKVLINSEGNEDVRGALTAALYSIGGSRNIGEPPPCLVKRLKDLKALQDATRSSHVIRFTQDLIKMTEQEIETQLQEDEEFLEGEEW